MRLPVDIYRYLDFRALLRDYYRAKKAERRGFSYRSFARRAGLRSPNHLQRVMEGQRSLSPRSTQQYALAMGLGSEPANYFAALVRFNQAKTREDREAAYERVRSFRGYRKAHKIDAEYADYHAHWYVPAIREMATREDFRPDPKWIAERMIPKISADEASRAIDILFGLGMLVRQDDGRVRQAEPVVTTGDQTRGLHIARYHRTMLQRADDAISSVPAEQRFVSSLTFSVGPEGFERVQQRVQRFRRELIAMLAEEKDAQQVLQLGIQLFPLTTCMGSEP